MLLYRTKELGNVMNDIDSLDNQMDNTGTLTSERLRDLVLDHVLANANVYLAEDMNTTERFLKMLESMNELAQNIAIQSIANRQHLSALPTFDSIIDPNPEADAKDGTHYELRYRLVEQMGDNKPYKDNVYSLAEAQEIYGDSFIENHWGKLGERSPCKVSVGDRQMWFTTVRYPVLNQDVQSSPNTNSKYGLTR